MNSPSAHKTKAPASPDHSTPTSRLWADACANPAIMASCLISLGLFACIFWSTGVSLVTRWWNDPDYSHGFLVPIVSYYLFQQSMADRSRRQPLTVQGGIWLGGGFLALGLLLAWFATLVPSLVVEGAAMLLTLSGGVLLVGGRSWWRVLWGPIAFLVFMIPWPSSWYSQVAFPLQLMVSQWSAALLQVAGIPVLCDGNLIHLPGHTMHVAQACSGMRQLTAFLAIAVGAALILDRPLWHRMALLASAIPIAVIVNVTRVTLTASAFYVGVGDWTLGIMHTAEGLVMIAVGFFLFVLETRLLDWLTVEPSGHAPRMIPVGGVS